MPEKSVMSYFAHCSSTAASVINDGFRSTSAAEGAGRRSAARFDAEREVGPLPQRMRFTLAHEIAHTLFYDISPWSPQTLFQS